MLNPTQKGKITKFLEDKLMADSVYEVVLDSFLKPKPNSDVYKLAASRLAIDMLGEAWKEMEKYQANFENEKAEVRQIGM